MGEIKALTSLRGLAAMMVVMQHFSATAQRHAAVPIPSLVPHGYMAVDLFFTLSGFIMAYTYHADFARHGVRAMPDFLVKRAARILPLNTTMVVVIVLAGMLSRMLSGNNIFSASNHVLFDAACNIFLLQGFGIGMNLNGPSWSICTEFAAYLLFPVLLALAFSRRFAIMVLTVLVAVGALTIVALNHPRLGLDTSLVAGALTQCFAQFVIGLCTFRCTLVPWARRLLKADWPAALAGAWIAMALILRVDLLAAAGFPVAVAALACNDGRIKRVMSMRALYFLGEISFSIYLVHDPLRALALASLRFVHPFPIGAAPALGFGLLSSLLVIPPAWLAYVVIERPGRRFVRRLQTETGVFGPLISGIDGNETKSRSGDGLFDLSQPRHPVNR